MNRKRILWVALALCASASTARADLTWEHTVAVRFGGMQAPMAQGRMKNSLTAQRYRFDFNAGMPGMGGSLGALTARNTNKAPAAAGQVCGPTPDKFEVASIQRFDDDTVMSFSSADKFCYTDSYKDYMSKMRFDPWKKLAPRLSTEMPETLTQAQRDRLGAEVRSALRPVLKKVMRTYFRPLPEKRSFDGLDGHGYRMTLLFNAGGWNDQQWVRVSTEWWLADPQPGDEIIDAFYKTSNEKRAALNMAFPSTSFWLNEMAQVYWASFPQEFHMAADTMFPREFKFQGTPLRIYMTVQPPALYQMGMGGDFRLEIALVSRSVEPLAAAVFDAPAGYTKKPFISPWDELEKAVKGHIPDIFSASRESGLSWKAWDDTMREARMSAFCTPQT